MRRFISVGGGDHRRLRSTALWVTSDVWHGFPTRGAAHEGWRYTWAAGSDFFNRLLRLRHRWKGGQSTSSFGFIALGAGGSRKQAMASRHRPCRLATPAALNQLLNYPPTGELPATEPIHLQTFDAGQKIPLPARLERGVRGLLWTLARTTRRAVALKPFRPRPGLQQTIADRRDRD